MKKLENVKIIKSELVSIEDQDNLKVSLKVGSIFYHYKNTKPYIVLGFCKIQENNNWIEAVLYTDLETYKQAKNPYKIDKFVRSLKEFKSKFQKLSVTN